MQGQRSESFDDYCRKVSEAFYPMEVRGPRGAGPLATRFSSQRQGLFRMTRGTVRHETPIFGARAWRNIDAATPDEFILVTPVSTTLAYRQFGRLAEVQQGGNVLLDARSPYEFERRVPGAIICHHIPGFLLRAVTAHPEELCAIAIAPKGVGAVIQSLVGAIWQNIGDMDDSERNLLMGNVAALLPAACRAGATTKPTLAREAHLIRATRYIEAHLDDPALSVTEVAAGIGLSASHLHALSRRNGVTIGGMIQTMRLERCARAFRATDSGAERITDVAYRWGFGDPAHFSRAFRRHFGMSPSAYRAHHHRPH